jgi:hypothetical protein
MFDLTLNALEYMRYQFSRASKFTKDISKSIAQNFMTILVLLR